MDIQSLTYIFDNTDKKYIIKIVKERISISIYIQNVENLKIYKNIITWNDIQNKKIDNLDKYFIFLKKVFSKNDGFLYKINEINMVTSFSSRKVLYLYLEYICDFIDFKDSYQLDELV